MQQKMAQCAVRMLLVKNIGVFYKTLERFRIKIENALKIAYTFCAT